jgi:PAS domain S-box-containing protein
VPVHFSFSRFSTADTRILCGVVTDLSHQKERWRALVEATPQLVWSWLPDGGCDYLSPQWIAYTGVPEAEQHGFRWLAAIHPDGRERVHAAGHAAVAEHAQYDLEYRLRRHDGAYRWFQARGVMVRDATGRIARWFGTSTDIDEQKRATADLRELHETLERRVEERTRELAVETAERAAAEEALRQAQKMQALGQLTGGIAHDFNNLLTVIQGSADFLRRPDLSRERRERYIGAIAETASRAASLTQQLLAFARKQPLKPEVFNLNRRMPQIAGMLGRMIGAHYRLDIDLAPDLWPIEVDPNQLEIALVNIGVNARDAMPEGGALIIKARNAALSNETGTGLVGEFVCLSVADTGSGMTPEIRDRVFDPFFTTKDVGKGTGLGLSQVYGFAAQSGGDVRIESEAGRGTTIILHVPRARTEPKPVLVESAPEQLEAGQGLVLLVEDNSQVGEFAQTLLEELGYGVIRAESAPAALRILEGGADVDIVFSDVVMPGMTGVDLARELKRGRPGLPVVLTTGYSDPLAGGGAGEFPLLSKPYRMDSVAAILRRTLARKGAAGRMDG